MRLRSSAVWMTVLLALAATSAAAQTITLRYDWQQGEELTYKTTVRTTTALSGGPGGTRTIEQTMSQTLKLSVSAVFPDGGATVRQVIQAVTLDMDTPAGKVSYDSAKPPAEDADPQLKAMGRTMGAMVGEAISVTMAANGAVKRIDGTARIVDKIMADLPRDPMAGSLAQNIRAMLSEDTLRTSIEQNFSRLPDTPVKIGDTWSAQHSVGADAIGKIVGTTTFTLKAVEGTGEAAVARISAALSLKQQDAPPAGGSMVVKLTGGSGEGELLFELAKGRVAKNGMRTEMSSSARVRGPDGGALDLQNSTRTTMTMELIK